MPQNADAAREAARRPDGKFGEQARAEDTVVDLLPPPTEGALAPTPLLVRMQPQQWINDYAVDSGPMVEFDLAPVLASLDPETRKRVTATLIERGGSSDAGDLVYEKAVEMGLAEPHDGPFYVDVDCDALVNWNRVPRTATGSVDVAAAVRDRIISGFDTKPFDAPKTVSFHGHWEGDTIVVEAIYDGEVPDTRPDTGYWPEGMWASWAAGSSDAEIAAAMLVEYEESGSIRVASTDDDMTPPS